MFLFYQVYKQDGETEREYFVSAKPEISITDAAKLMTKKRVGSLLLIEDEQLRYNMGQAGRKKVLLDFDLKTNTAKLSKLFLNKWENS